MKIRNFLRFALAGVLAFSISSCEDDDDGSLGASLIVTETVSGATGGSININQGNSLVFVWDARKGDTDMETFEVSVTGVNTPNPIPTSLGGNTFPYDIANADDETYIDTLIFPSAGINVGVTSYTFTVTDKDGNVDNVTFTVNTVASATPMTNTVNGAFFHIAGSLEGAYDLINEDVVSASAPGTNKDMANTDQAGAAFTGSWEAQNATLFVKDNSFDYANATVEAATSAFALSSSPSNTVNNPMDGDIYIAKLRGGNNYAVIEIVTVDPSDNTCNCGNTGKITFNFKK